jgi:hypothetical protein
LTQVKDRGRTALGELDYVDLMSVTINLSVIRAIIKDVGWKIAGVEYKDKRSNLG